MQERLRSTAIFATIRARHCPRSLAINAQVQVSVVLHDVLERVRDQRVLGQELADDGAIGELQRLRAAVRQLRGRAKQGLPLVDAVAEGVDVLPPRGVRQGLGPAGPRDLGLEGAQLPLQGLGAVGALVGRARRHDFDALDDRQQLRQELQAAQFDPPALRVRQQHHGAAELREAQRLAGGGGDLGEAGALPRADHGAGVQPQALRLDPTRRQDGVVPIEHEQCLLARERRRPSGGADVSPGALQRPRRDLGIDGRRARRRRAALRRVLVEEARAELPLGGLRLVRRRWRVAVPVLVVAGRLAALRERRGRRGLVAGVRMLLRLPARHEGGADATRNDDGGGHVPCEPPRRWRAPNLAGEPPTKA
eukprot:CAMPEP_0176236980 /NCGR_PEP_ID=MMETSP0121_2-20121125/27616_1 /TAXON_ID=160619 /ORGANISM="Kryptoperidinium foliaceum, Strain CCMP 1326" /LENGTH=364 /DNA_ID=CAMNT_0017576415 /DNA_START=91 /DNA_END=1182 /DNA_ORIENTATION=-